LLDQTAIEIDYNTAVEKADFTVFGSEIGLEKWNVEGFDVKHGEGARWTGTRSGGGLGFSP
jgi:hypothetical protein